MAKNSAMTLISFRSMILDCYKKLGLNENELVVILMVDHLLEQGNTLITGDALSLKMKLSASEIDSILANLMSRNLVTYEETGFGLITSIENVRAQAYEELKKSIHMEEEDGAKDAFNTRKSKHISFFEEKYGRGLSPLECGMIGEWINAGFKDDEITDALLDCLRSNSKSIKAVDRALRNKRREEDIIKEGVSSVDDIYDDDIDKTIELAKRLWNVDEDK
ncbi:MAG: DnaD domain protein [Bacilli bacterium]|nr:DnaD domain protein [Bacilli bacterium]